MTTAPTETLRELLMRTGAVLDNPMLLRIVEAAPSPTAADKHILDLGWSNRLAGQVRGAVRLRERAGDRWAEWKATQIRPVQSIFTFEDDCREELGSIRLSAQANFGTHGDDVVAQYRWPFFLREGYFTRDGNGITTFDGDGRGTFTSTHELKFLNLLHGGRPSLIQQRFGDDRSLTLECGGTAHTMWNLSKAISVDTKPVVLTPDRGRVFPAFFKAVILQRRWPGQPTETIKIFMRQDVGPGKRGFMLMDESHLVYQKTLVVVPALEAVLTVKYQLAHNFGDVPQLHRLSNEWDVIRLQLGPRHYFGFSANENFQGQVPESLVRTAMDALLGDASRLVAASPSPSIEKIAGYGIIKDPPASLLELLL